MMVSTPLNWCKREQTVWTSMRWDTRWGLKNTLLDISHVFRIINARSNIRNDGINIPKVMQKRANDLDRYKVRYQWIIGWDTWSLKIALSDIAVAVCIVNAPSNTWNGDPNSVQMTQKQLNDPEWYEVRYQWTYREIHDESGKSQIQP